jgi:catechol 2,3-dioxygenase-like lactoylglutathione lyase family enzyme
MSSFRADAIDHVELFVPDRYVAAGWYERVLGLTIVREREHWAEDPGGPLMISSDGGRTMLALFTGSPAAGGGPTVGFHRVAFRTDGTGFLDFLARLATTGLFGMRGQPLTAAEVVDHGKAFSIYFLDPWGHHLEVTTYEHDRVASTLEERR